MEMSSPRVTVILSTYNWSSVLPYSIGSVLWQTFKDFELLVIGDACTDDSQDVVRSISDDRIQWINLPINTGSQWGPNNEGLKQARGEYVAYLGHDDLWLPKHLEFLVGALEEKRADLAYGFAKLINANGRELRLRTARGDYEPGLAIPPTSIVHRLSIFERIGGWHDHQKLKITTDTDFWERAFKAGFQFTFVPRLTSIRFPACVRQNVYKKQPCHEQKLWAARIKNEPDFEQTELGDMLSNAWCRTCEAWQRFSAPPGSIIAKWRAFKGLDPERKQDAVT